MARAAGQKARKRGGEAISHAGDLGRARALIQKQGNIKTGLENFRFGTSPLDLLRLAPRLSVLPAYRPLIWPRPFPKTFAEIPSRGMAYYAGYPTELAWAAGTLLPHAGKLACFLKLRHEFNAAVLVGSASEAERILQAVEDELGVSLWLLEQRLNLLQEQGHVRAQRDYVRSSLRGSPPTLVRFLSSWLAYKSEVAVSAPEIRRLLEQERSDGVGVIVRGLMGEYASVTTDLVGQTLSFTDALPVVDRYLLLVMGQQLLAASGPIDGATADVTRAAVGSLAASVPDPQLSLLALAIGAPGAAATSDVTLLSLLDAYDAGRYGDVVQEVQGAPADALSIELVNLGVRAAALAGSCLGPLSSLSAADTALGSMVNDLGEVVGFGPQATEASLRLRKRQLTHCGASWASSLALVLERQRNDERALEPSIAQVVHALRSVGRHPDVGFCLPSSSRERYLDLLATRFPDCFSIAATRKVLDGGDEFPPDVTSNRTLRLTAIAHARKRRWAEAALLLETASSTEASGVIQIEASLLLLRCYLEQGRLADCAALAVQLYISNGYIGSVIPIARLVEELVKVHDEPMSTSPTRGLLSVAIVYDIYSRYVGPDRDAERADAFKDVLRRAGVSRASQLVTFQQAYDLDQLIYFWRQVCVPDVLDQSLALQSTREVEDERVAILVALGEVMSAQNRTQPAELKDELREIRTRQVVRETTLRLDQSKVYVNVEGIRRALDVTMRDNWHRYRIMGLQESGSNVFQELERVVKSVSGDRVLIMLNAETMERGKLLARMAGEVIEMFAYSKEFGLDSNLSTNIRHGYVLRELRGPLLALKLITNRSSLSGDYQVNSTWVDRLQTPEEGHRLTGILDRFSARVDELIDHVNRKLLRIRSAQLPEGLFVYPQTDEVRVGDFERRCADLETHDQFLDAMIEQCWLLTDRNLTRVRDALNGDVLESFGAALTDLGAELVEADFGSRLAALANAITMARSDVRSAVTRVASWFTLSGNNEYQDYDLRIAFEAGLKTVKTYYADVDITSSLTASDTVLLRGWTLPVFARLFFLLLDNAALHGAADREKLKISCSMEVKPDTLLVKVMNDLPPGYDAAALVARVAEINAEYGRDKASELLRQEGGSGYPKIWKLLNFDLRRNHALSVALVDDEFVVEVMVDSKGLV